MAGWKGVVVAGALATGSVLWAAPPAGANAVTTGDCVGSGVWEGSGQDETSTEHDPGDVITIPREDTVEWEGAISPDATGEVPEREIEGAVEIQVSGQWIVVDDWGPNQSVRAGNFGTHHYDLPKILQGIEIPLRGKHFEDGELVCEGSVKVKVDGSATSNPLFVVGLALFVMSGALLFYAGRIKIEKVSPT